MVAVRVTVPFTVMTRGSASVPPETMIKVVSEGKLSPSFQVWLSVMFPEISSP
jgi:hypothetical protein